MPMDADSFRGKVWLLVIDKVVLGALIALALVAYDLYRTRDARNYDSLTKETQLTVERARLAKEVLPIITSKEQDVTTRGFTLGESVRTGAIPSNAAIALGPGLLRDGLSPLDFVDIMELTVPKGVAAIGRHGKELWSKLGDLSDSSDSSRRYDLRTFAYATDDPHKNDLNAIAREVGAWGQVLSDLNRTIKPSACGFVDAPIMSDYSWAGIFFLLAPRMSPPLAEELSRSPCQTFQVVGNVERFLKDGNDQQAAAAVASVILPKTLEFYRRMLSSDVLGILLSYGPSSSEAIAEPVARVLVGQEFWKSRTDPQEEALNDVQYCAAELLGSMVQRRQKADTKSTFAAEHVLCEFLAKSGERLNNMTVEDIIKRQAEDYAEREAEKYTIQILQMLGSSNANGSVSKFLSIDSGKLSVAGFDRFRK